MFPDLHKRVKKIGQPPGSAIYTGKKKASETYITLLCYSESDFYEARGKTLEEVLPPHKQPGVTTWIHVAGLQNITLIEQLAKLYHIHPLTVEDILNVDQRPKVEEFENYLFITLKMLFWNEKRRIFTTKQISFVLGKDFLLSFEENENIHFKPIRERLQSSSSQRMRQQGSDYLAYRLMDSIVDYYFVVLEGLGDQIEKVEDAIISDPTPQNTRTIYRLKRQLMSLRKSIWPMREAISHLTQLEKIFTPFTRIYLRDLYDHVVQAIDTVETFRDILASMLDVYLSSLSTRMNEIMKTLTIIATIFIPITFIASFYGMNFQYMPELHWRHGYAVVIGIMSVMVIMMLIYFRRKKWI
ncbi:MAG TPA: magnesium/cobalt transporter CorA [Gammaproteobacteria bacterium]|nr:magnesium/cobalt transporter CorA [Gammaproteobacteria bacterium]